MFPASRCTAALTKTVMVMAGYIAKNSVTVN